MGGGVTINMAMQGYMLRGQRKRSRDGVRGTGITNCSCPGRRRRWSRWGGCPPAASAAASPGRLCPWCRDSWTGAASVGPDRCRGPWSLGYYRRPDIAILDTLHVTTSQWRCQRRRSPRFPCSPRLLSLSVTNFKCHSLRATLGRVRYTVHAYPQYQASAVTRPVGTIRMISRKITGRGGGRVTSGM